VVEVDVARKRIGLTMKSDGGGSARDRIHERAPAAKSATGRPVQAGPGTAGGGTAFFDALKDRFGR
jgi:uncharacterized protein